MEIHKGNQLRRTKAHNPKPQISLLNMLGPLSQVWLASVDHNLLWISSLHSTDKITTSLHIKVSFKIKIQLIRVPTCTGRLYSGYLCFVDNPHNLIHTLQRLIWVIMVVAWLRPFQKILGQFFKKPRMPFDLTNSYPLWKGGTQIPIRKSGGKSTTIVPTNIRNSN